MSIIKTPKNQTELLGLLKDGAPFSLVQGSPLYDGIKNMLCQIMIEVPKPSHFQNFDIVKLSELVISDPILLKMWMFMEDATQSYMQMYEFLRHRHDLLERIMADRPSGFGGGGGQHATYPESTKYSGYRNAGSVREDPHYGGGEGSGGRFTTSRPKGSTNYLGYGGAESLWGGHHSTSRGSGGSGGGYPTTSLPEGSANYSGYGGGSGIGGGSGDSSERVDIAFKAIAGLMTRELTDHFQGLIEHLKDPRIAKALSVCLNDNSEAVESLRDLAFVMRQAQEYQARQDQEAQQARQDQEAQQARQDQEAQQARRAEEAQLMDRFSVKKAELARMENDIRSLKDEMTRMWCPYEIDASLY